MDYFQVYCASSNRYQIYTLPTGETLHLTPGFGRCDNLYCARDGKQVAFPDQLGLWNYDTGSNEPLGGKMVRKDLLLWEEYALTWSGQHFLKIFTVSRHETYELAKIA